MLTPSQRTPVSLEAAGIGAIQALPAATANGTALPARPDGAQGILLILGPNDSVTLTYTTRQQGAPTAPPVAANCATYAGSTNQTGDVETAQFFSADLTCYVTAATPGARFRWM